VIVVYKVTSPFCVRNRDTNLAGNSQ